MKPLQALIDEYARRISRYLSVEVAAVKTAADGAMPARAGDFRIVLDERGKSFSSPAFARWLEEKKLRSVKNLVFFVGPAEGFAEAVRNKADFVLSLSPFTLQHELALVVLLEQIYRACTILKGEPYHK